MLQDSAKVMFCFVLTLYDEAIFGDKRSLIMWKVRAVFDRNELKFNSLDNCLCKSSNASPKSRQKYWS
jgi:hypothetical protein